MAPTLAGQGESTRFKGHGHGSSPKPPGSHGCGRRQLRLKPTEEG